MKACGAASTPPSTIVSRNFTRPSATHGPTSSMKAWRRSRVVADDEAAELEALADRLHQLEGRGGVVVVARDRPAQGRAAARAQGVDRRGEVLAADVVEVDVDAVRRGLAQQLGDLAVVVVERGVEAELVFDPRDLLGRAGGADHGVALELRDLAGERADGARGAAHEHHVALAQLRDVQQADVRGQARHPEHADERGLRHARGRRRSSRACSALDHGDLTPAEAVQDEVALGEPVDLARPRPRRSRRRRAARRSATAACRT